ncbi:adenosylcobinamide amidohydrolase [Spirilliplanes yamanashiensis]|uniref:adenosylcobinamide amidohydrolase n=1 Tax=Spirilliplanes yamanashiensis TaxID=42233 RepID=UPI001EF1CC98|nr:adenosylcobinamide amidohydrolase [Spirilliplanes yamanashiensis]MDP9814622.1 adenosylcobinamide amidohydrolase [Spirilliplanes yamanashiensis]
MDPQLTTRAEGGRAVPVLVWRPERPLMTVSSAVLGGGLGLRHWVVNATVPMSYHRDDPADHLAELARGLGLRGPGVGLLTGVDVGEVVTADDGGVRVWATVGLGTPTLAAAPDAPAVTRPGTVNVVAHLPALPGPGALVNLVATAAEAKAQAMTDLGLVATGTATDAVTVLCDPDGPAAEYGGPRSRWGARLARAVHRAVVTRGIDTVPWSDRAGF